MTLPKSHKTAVYADQIRQHAPTGKAAYGTDTSGHPGRQVSGGFQGPIQPATYRANPTPEDLSLGKLIDEEETIHFRLHGR